MKGKKVALYGMLTALAMVLSYVETFIPLSVAVPGVKLGLTNIAVLFALYKLGLRGAAAVSLVRVVLSAILFGNAFSLTYSLAGACVSLAVMALLRRCGRFSVMGVSVAGGTAHNLAQIAVAAIALNTAGLLGYLPVLIVSGTVAGVCVGIAAAVLIKRVDPKVK